MNRNSRIAQLTATVMFACVTLACPVANAQTVIKISLTDNALPFESPMSAMSVVFKNVVETETNGSIKVNIFPSSQLGSEREVFESMRLGIVQAQVGGEGATANFFPPMLALGIPYLYPSMEVAFAVMDGSYGAQLKEAMRRDIGIRILASSAPGPFRNFGTAKPIRTVDDLKGLRIRTIENPAYETMIKALGASPTPIAFGEVYSALKSGVVDGVELPYQAVLNMKLDEVIKYMILDQHMFQQVFLFVNDKWFQSLSAEQRKAVEHAAHLAELASRGQVYTWEAAGAAQLRAKGVTLTSLSESEILALKNKAQPPVVSWLRQRVDPKWVDGIIQAVANASKSK